MVHIVYDVMITKSLFSLAFALVLLLSASLGADQESLDELVKQEQAKTDNEAVSGYGGIPARGRARTGRVPP